MPKTIIQKIIFKNTTPPVLYEFYMNAKKHSQTTGAPARITTKEGSTYSTHGGYITGKNLKLVKDKLIVQTWRTVEWRESDIDSIFSLAFEAKGKDVIVHVVHSNLPDKHAGHIDKGWYKHYWEPWKNYLAGKAINVARM